MVLQSSLGFYLERLTNEDNLAAVVIMNGMTITIIIIIIIIIIIFVYFHHSQISLSYR